MPTNFCGVAPGLGTFRSFVSMSKCSVAVLLVSKPCMTQHLSGAGIGLAPRSPIPQLGYNPPCHHSILNIPLVALFWLPPVCLLGVLGCLLGVQRVPPGHLCFRMSCRGLQMFLRCFPLPPDVSRRLPDASQTPACVFQMPPDVSPMASIPPS